MKVSKKLFALVLTLAIVMSALFVPLTVFADSAPISTNSNVNPLNGKSVLFVGDSITKGVGDDQLYGWAGRIGNANNMKWMDAGSPGATVSKSGNHIVDFLEHDGEFDYVILHGGLNDCAGNIALGMISDSFELYSFDNTTFAGGLEELFYYANQYYPTAQIGFVVNYALPTWEAASNRNLGKYMQMAKDICDKWKIPYIDLYFGKDEKSGLYYSADILNTDTNECLADDVHLNGNGYSTVAPYIEKWMKEDMGLAELKALYNEYKDVPSTYYTSKSYADLESALESAKSVLDTETVSALLQNQGDWLMPDALSNYFTSRSIEQFKIAHPGTAVPISVSNDGRAVRVTYNPDSMGYYKDSANSWGMHSQWYDLSLNKKTVNFNSDVFDFDVAFARANNRNWHQWGEIILHFDNIGDVTITCLSNGGYGGVVPSTCQKGIADVGFDYAARIGFADIYANLTAEQKAYLDSHNGIDTLNKVTCQTDIDILFNEADPNANSRIDIFKFNILRNQIDFSDALSKLKSAVDGLVKTEIYEAYCNFLNVDSSLYTAESYSALKTAMDIALTELKDREDVSLLGNINKWNHLNKYGQYVSYRDFRYHFPTWSNPFIFSEDDDGVIHLPYNNNSRGYNKNDAVCWGMQQQYYVLGEDALSIDFTQDQLDFALSFYCDAGKNPYVLGNIILNFSGGIGDVTVTSGSAERYNTHNAVGYGRGYSGLINFSDLKDYMTDAQKTALTDNNNMVKLNEVKIYINNDSVYHSVSTVGIDIYNFEIIRGQRISDADLISAINTAYGNLALSEYGKLVNIYNQYKNTVSTPYTAESFAALKSALNNAEETLEIKLNEELVTDINDWCVVRPGVGTKISQAEFATIGSPYEFPLNIIDNGDYVTLQVRSHGIYEGASTNWQGRQNYYVLKENKTFDFANDSIDFDVSFYMNFTQKNPFIQGIIVFNFAELGSVRLNSSEVDKYMIPTDGNKGRRSAGIISGADFINKYLSDEQKVALSSNGNKATLTGFDIYHNSDSLWGNNESDPQFGIDVYKVNVVHTDAMYTNARTVVENAVSALEKTNLGKLYDSNKDNTEAAKAIERAEGILNTESNIPLLDKVKNWRFGGSFANYRTTYFTADEYLNQFGKNAIIPMFFTKKNGNVTVSVNRENIGYYQAGSACWGLPMARYDIRNNPATVDFTKDSLTVDMKFFHTSGSSESQHAGGYATLYFEKLGAIKLNTLANVVTFAGQITVNADFADAVTSEQLALLTDGTDKLLYVDIVFPNRWNETNDDFKLRVTDFTIHHPMETLGAESELSFIDNSEICGDVNDDGKCDILDMVRLKKYFADSTVEINECYANVVTDDVIDVKDLAALRKVIISK